MWYQSLESSAFSTEIKRDENKNRKPGLSTTMVSFVNCRGSQDNVGMEKANRRVRRVLEEWESSG